MTRINHDSVGQETIGKLKENPIQSRILLLIVFLSITMGTSFGSLQQRAFSATISHEFRNAGENTFKKIVINFDGKVEAGDTEKLRALLRVKKMLRSESYEFMPAVSVINLNSPGGSLAESIKLLDFFITESIQTYVGNGNSCLSACAIAFLGGTQTQEVFKSISRSVHPNGRLGIHAPSLSVSNIKTVKASDLSKAYRLALKTIAKLVDRKTELALPDSFISKFLNTSPQNMYILSEVEDFARWNIDVALDLNHYSVDKSGISRLCHNIDYWKAGTSVSPRPTYGMYQVTSEVGFRTDQLNNKKVYQVLFTGEEDLTCFAVHHKSVYGEHFEVLYSSENRRSVLKWIDEGHGDFQIASVLFTMPPETKIANFHGDESLISFKKPKIKSENPNGRCQVRSHGRVVEEEPCLEFTQGAVTYYLWPSGGKTVLEPSKSGLLLNGATTEFIASIEFECLKSHKTGNVFCYKSD